MGTAAARWGLDVPRSDVEALDIGALVAFARSHELRAKPPMPTEQPSFLTEEWSSPMPSFRSHVPSEASYSTL